MTKKNELGKWGETLAVNYLEELGYQIKQRNYRYLKAEIDIIAQKNNLLVIVEVKSRKNDFYEDLVQTVGVRKQKLIVMAADHFVQSLELNVEVRFDIITIVQKGHGYAIEHMPSAFYHF